jgi:tRNA A-37 threonylcarbamoyl transferase component Bud32
MPLTLHCSCGAKLRAREDLAGKYVRCPKCKQPVQVPVAETPVPGSDAAAAASPPMDDPSAPPDQKTSASPLPPERFTSLGDRGTFVRETDDSTPRAAESSRTSLGDRATYDSDSGGQDARAPADLASLGDRGTRAGDEVVVPREAPAAPTRLPTVPGYEILELLGHGGMGVVYKARHLKLKRLVALKMILSGAHASAKQLARFRAEAEAAARLRHPHVIQIYEIGEADGYPYLALEFAEGGSLEQKTRREPQPPREAAELVKSLAEAIEHCHQQQVVHRDLKPANVLLADGVAKITDFGLAKQLESSEEGEENRNATKTGAVLGTPGYMAPEQARGDSEVGPLADVYALGALLYELLTGRPPFTGSTPVETIQQVLERDPVAPSLLQPNVPKDLQTICLKCLRKEVPERYAGAQELAEDLRRFLDGEPILARPVGIVERTIKWIVRRRVVATLTLAATLLAAIGLWQWWSGGILSRTNLDMRRRSYADQMMAINKVADRRRELERFVPQPNEADVRGWEWYYLNVKTETVLPTTFNVLFRTVDDSAKYFRENNGPFLLSHSGERIVRLVARYVQTAPESSELRYGVVVSQVGPSADDKQPNVIDPLAELMEVRAFPGNSLLFAWSPDDSRLALAERGGSSATVWDVTKGTKLITIGAQAVDALSWSPDGAYLATQGRDGEYLVTLWDADDGRRLHGFGSNLPHLTGAPVDQRSGSDIEWSPNGKLMAGDETVWNPFTGEVLFQFTRNSTGMTSRPNTRIDGRISAWHPDGERLVVSDGDGPLTVWNYKRGVEIGRSNSSVFQLPAGTTQATTMGVGWLETGDRIFVRRGYSITTRHGPIHKEYSDQTATILYDSYTMQPVLQLPGAASWDAQARRVLIPTDQCIGMTCLALCDPWRLAPDVYKVPDHRVGPLPTTWKAAERRRLLQTVLVFAPRTMLGMALLLLGISIGTRFRSVSVPRRLRRVLPALTQYAPRVGWLTVVLLVMQFASEVLLGMSMFANLLAQSLTGIAAMSAILLVSAPVVPSTRPEVDELNSHSIRQRIVRPFSTRLGSIQSILNNNSVRIARLCAIAGALHLISGAAMLF